MTTTYKPGHPIWCAGCGHFGVQSAMKVALKELEIPAHETLILAGIGCSGTVQNNMLAYGYHALHGRVLPTATGAAVCNPDLTVIAAGGDGDGYAIGLGHLMHTFKRNPSLTYIVMNNGTYGLTKGQNSPTASVSRNAAIEEALDAMTLGLSVPGSTFMARGFTRNAEQLIELIKAGISHSREGKGFSFIEVLSPCVTYNDTYPKWDRDVIDLDSDDSFDPTNRSDAFSRVMGLRADGRVPIGMIYNGAGDAFEKAWYDDRTEAPFFQSPEPARHAARLDELLHTYEV